MFNIDPPLEERETDELIAIAHSTSDEWQPEIRELARLELIQRNISLKEQQRIINNWYDSIEQAEKQNSTESYTKLEMVKIILLAPMYLTAKAFPDYSLSELKAENYIKKYKQRITLLIAGVILYVIMMVGLVWYVDFSSKRNAEKADIREWENNRINPK